jgi:hypothetical protein
MALGSEREISLAVWRERTRRCQPPIVVCTPCEPGVAPRLKVAGVPVKEVDCTIHQHFGAKVPSENHS